MELQNRLIRWAKYNLLFSLLPFGCHIVLRALAEKLDWTLIASSPELLFFSLMISMTSVSDLSELKSITQNMKLKILEAILSLGGVSCAVLYGAHLYNGMSESPSPHFQYNLFITSIFTALFLFILSTVVQIILGLSAKQP